MKPPQENDTKVELFFSMLVIAAPWEDLNGDTQHRQMTDTTRVKSFL